MASRFECPRCQTVFVKDIAGDAAFVECPSCGALALPAGDATEGAFERAVSASQVVPTGLASTETEMDPAAPDPSAPAPGMFTDLLSSTVQPPEASDAPSSEESAPPTSSASSGGAPSVSGSARAPELDFDFGLDIDLPALPPPPTRSPLSSEGPSLSSSSLEGPAVHALPPEALAALAADAEAGPTNSQHAPWSGLSEDAFGDLEKAFDEMALKPVPPPLSGSGLSTDEERFLRDEASSPSLRPPPLRRVDGERTDRNAAPPRPPPKKRSRRPRPTHFELSPEAKDLAFLPLKPETSAPVVRPRLEADLPVLEPRRPASSSADGRRAVQAEHTDVVRPGREPKKPVPSPLAGLTFVRAAAILLVCAALGGLGGALSAPKPKGAHTARERAELQFAAGNRFYDAGRYDDALGAFRGALSINPTYALAHRAKGAALAKLSRYDEAADAYEEYLKLEDKAGDAKDVAAAIARRRGDKKAAADAEDR